MNITSFLDQHKGAAEIVGQIESHISSGSVGDPSAVRTLLSSLVGKLSIHLAMEDKNIYPKAAVSDNAELKAMSARLQTEMSGLADVLKSYSGKWSNASDISASQSEFIAETKGIVSALKNRISVEERDFYPLVEKYL
ncbi:MAG: hemerythrin domain-containing protein [Alphaproteobacteria bacterium]|jgi:hemerythrin-like domain-containing protein|nr:hemerythrin domain-containing protein [Alphaproteobacteria bacterium]MCB1550674.1 hemerythrin domain-containing protein [Alphaproteobacteria bacterium]MCB9985339.1 hemerythrin domain-containing protein [Micavibrio sp.]HRK98118.1 hemerythrin domain-containing protein [Alphaproteobacteria bacterium]